jgi:hypothetical protein
MQKLQELDKKRQYNPMFLLYDLYLKVNEIIEFINNKSESSCCSNSCSKNILPEEPMPENNTEDIEINDDNEELEEIENNNDEEEENESCS